MGNSLGGKRKSSTKVMKITGETMKIKTPVKAEEVVREYPGHVLLESESVKQLGVRAEPLQAQQLLEAKRLYFLVELPRDTHHGHGHARRVRSGINMSAKDRLESLMLSRRSVSDLTAVKPTAPNIEINNGATTRLKLRLPKAQVERLMKESNSDAEIAHKISDLCMHKRDMHSQNHNNTSTIENINGNDQAFVKPREKRVSFMPISEAGSQITVAA